MTGELPGSTVVTGAAGFIGSHLVDLLLRSGVEVVGIDCLNDTYGRAAKLTNLRWALGQETFRLETIDLAEDEIDPVVEGADTIFHLAGEPGVRPSWGNRFSRYSRNNVLATQRLLDSASRLEAVRFVYASSSSIYGDAEVFPTPEDTTPMPISPYGSTKLAGEHLSEVYARSRKLDVRIVRYFTVFGPRQRPDMAFNIFCNSALDCKQITVFGDGMQTRDFTFVEDAARATLEAGLVEDPEFRVFNIGGGMRVTLVDVIEAIGKAAGGPLDVNFTSEQVGDVRDTLADVSRAKALLGFAPRTTLLDGISAELEWVRSLRRDHRPAEAGLEVSKLK